MAYKRKFNRAVCNETINRMVAALQPLAADLGIVIQRESATFSPAGLVVKIAASVVGDDGVAMSRAAESFQRLAARYGMSPEALGTTFKVRGREFTITGLNPRAHAMPLLAKDSSGRGFKFAIATYKAATSVDASVRP